MLLKNMKIVILNLTLAIKFKKVNERALFALLFSLWAVCNITLASSHFFFDVYITVTILPLEAK